MSVPDAVAAGRQAHRRLMVDACTIIRRSTEPSYDKTTAAHVNRAPVVVYRGPCRVKPVARTRDESVGVRESLVSRYDVALPHDVEVQIATGDVLTVITSTDAWLIGRGMVVVSIGLGTTATARWLTVEDQRG